MKPIDVFYQGSHGGKVDHIQVDASETVGAVKLRIIEKHGGETDVLIFLEDHDEPLDEVCIIESIARGNAAKVHVHRCRHVAASVAFGGKTVKREFGPGTTVAHVKRWAAETEFGMTKEDAGEHLLQLAGTHERPAPGTHIGSLAKCPDCRVAFDLVPDQRVNGFAHDLTPKAAA
jgi:hypothetical protein